MPATGSPRPRRDRSRRGRCCVSTPVTQLRPRAPSVCASGDAHDLGAGLRRAPPRARSASSATSRHLDDADPVAGEDAVIDEQAADRARGDHAGAIVVVERQVDGVAAGRPDPRARVDAVRGDRAPRPRARRRRPRGRSRSRSTRASTSTPASMRLRASVALGARAAAARIGAQAAARAQLIVDEQRRACRRARTRSPRRGRRVRRRSRRRRRRARRPSGSSVAACRGSLPRPESWRTTLFASLLSTDEPVISVW